MANINAPGLNDQVHAGTWGNKAVTTRAITLAAATVADVIRFVKLPAGARLLDLTVFNTASSASTTMTFGYAPVDGTAGDADHFLGAKSLATAARHRADTVTPPVVLAKDSYLVGTLAGANIATGTTITVVVEYEYVGV